MSMHEAEKKDTNSGFSAVAVSSFAGLKRALNVGGLFEIKDHLKPDMVGQIREVNIAQTNGIWSVVYGQPDHDVSKANGGKGSWMEFGKAGEYEIGETIKWFGKDKNRTLIMEFVILTAN